MLLYPGAYLKKGSKEGVFDAGRGCPFKCDFCTVVNIFGHEARSRSADDVEKIIRWNVANGVFFYFITDDNFSRNKNWEAIFDRLIALKEDEGISIKFQMQADCLSSKIPGFVEKAGLARCCRVFIGIESISDENIDFFNKSHNKTGEYRKLLQKWRDHDVVVIAGFIIGTPIDDEEGILKDVERLIDEVPADYFSFQILTPFPGSVFYRNEVEKGAWLHDDLNLYNASKLTFRHPNISNSRMNQVYKQVWDIIYKPSSVKRIMQRLVDEKRDPNHAMLLIIMSYGLIKFEKVHPYGGGRIRRKNRKSRRPGLPIKSPFSFYTHRIAGDIKKYSFWGFYALRILIIWYLFLERDDS